MHAYYRLKVGGKVWPRKYDEYSKAAHMGREVALIYYHVFVLTYNENNKVVSTTGPFPRLSVPGHFG